MALNREVWIDQVKEGFYPDDSFLQKATDYSQFVDHNRLHIASAGIDPKVLVNNTTYPISVIGRDDEDNEIRLDKFETELRQRLTDINYLTRQHAELMAAAQDAKAGDQEETNDEIIAEYQDDVMSYVKEYDALREEYGTLGRLAFRRRREILDKLATRADAIKAINKRYEQYDFIDFIAFELPEDEE